MDDRLLRTTLTVNAVFSGLAGAGTAVLAGVLSEPLGIPAPILVGVGIALLPYAALLWRFRSREVLRPVEAWIAIASDTAWVLASAVVLSLAVVSPLGSWVIGIVALGVADFAVLQYLGVRRLAGRVSPAPTGRRPVAR